MSNVARLDLELVSGDDELVEFVILEDDGTTPVDLDGRNYIMQVRAEPASTTAPECSFVCTVPAPETGTVVCQASSSETRNLVPGRSYFWSLLQLAAGDLSTLITGRVDAISQVSKD